MVISVFFFWFILAILFFNYFLERFLEYLNSTYWNDQLPKELESIYDPEKYRKSQEYEKHKQKFGFIVDTITLIAMIFILMVGGFSRLDHFIRLYTIHPILMAFLFTSWRMILISLIPNLIPQLMTAALMGYAGIPIKPSTILIFSIALGISVDNSIQYLSRYRLQLRHTGWKIRESVISALKETGYSMIYSSTVLFFGFAIFILSTFGGTQALGFLISFTLLVAGLLNLFILPSLLLTLDKWSTTKKFDEPMLEFLKEGEDQDINDAENVSTGK